MRWVFVVLVVVMSSMLRAEVVFDPQSHPLTYNGQPADVVEGRAVLQLRMGEQRVNWNNARWAVHEFAQPLAIKGSALRVLVTTDQPRSDAGVYLALREASGAWHYHPWTTDLTQGENVGVVHLSDFTPAEFCQPPGGHFTDPNGRLDTDQITAIAIGCINPMGVGEVRFSIGRIESLAVDDPAEEVRVELTGRLMTVGEQSHIPAAAFGYYLGPKNDPEKTYRLGSSRKIISTHATGGDPFFGSGSVTMAINCAGERIWPSARLTDPQWREKTIAYAEKLGQTVGTRLNGQPFYLEYFNEPYLNWANNNRANFIPRFYDESRAVEGGPVHIKHDGAEVPHLRWTQDPAAPRFKWYGPNDFRRGRDANGKVWSAHARPYHRGTEGVYGGPYNPAWHPPAEVKDGEKYTIKVRENDREREIEVTAFTPWHVHDETQFTYWSGEAMRFFYIEQARVLGDAAKKAYPQTQYLIGWGVRPSEDHWAVWNMLYRPTIDALIDITDGVHDHDYGGHPLKMTGNYETIAAYGMTRHGKLLKGYNTEQGANIDAQAYPDAPGQPRGRLADDARYRFASRKLMHLLSRSPDKVGALTHFDFTAGGEGQMFEQLLRLRGRLMHTRSSDERVMVVASLDDGSDPAAPLRDGDTPAICIAILNEDVRPRRIMPTMSLPHGLRAGEASILRRAHDGEGAVIKQASYTLNAAVELQPFELVTIVIPVEGTIGDAPPVRVSQRFARPVLEEVTPASAQRDEIKLDVAEIEQAERAWVRLVVERLADGEGSLDVNGTVIALPRAVTPENSPAVIDVPIDSSLLRESMTIEFRAAEGSAGYLLCSASVMIESR